MSTNETTTGKMSFLNKNIKLAESDDFWANNNEDSIRFIVNQIISAAKEQSELIDYLIDYN